MSGAARYALYLAPTPDSALWRFGSRVLGRDALTGEIINGYAPLGYEAAGWRAASDEPRRYGFHATLKAPFRLREGFSPADLEAAIEELARAHAPFSLGALDVTTISFGEGRGFVALTPRERGEALVALEADAVRRLDLFRAPMSEAERARRRPDRLSQRQRENLERWGYPYVLDDFRLHFTLSNAVAEADVLAGALAGDFARFVPDPTFEVDALALFIETAAGADFEIARRFPLRH